MLDLSSTDGRPRRRRIASGIGLLIAAAASFALWLLIATAAALIFLTWP
jgi:hypothetical protein